MPVEIPLNSTKESAVQKLLNKGYWLYSTQEKDGYKILEYKKDKTVRLWTKGNIIPIVSWKLYFPSGAELLFNNPEADGIEMELKSVYGIEPYASSVEKGKNGSIEDEFKYFHWKGNTIILGYYELFILSNADAKKKIKEEETREAKRIESEQREREQRTTKYSSCRFLFGTDIEFNFWITQTYNTVHNELIRRIDKKMQKISDAVVVGTELSDKDAIREDLIAVCNICVNLNGDNTITDHVRTELTTFVLKRDYLNRAYEKSNMKDYVLFLLEYCNGK